MKPFDLFLLTAWLLALPWLGLLELAGLMVGLLLGLSVADLVPEKCQKCRQALDKNRGRGKVRGPVRKAPTPARRSKVKASYTPTFLLATPSPEQCLGKHGSSLPCSLHTDATLAVRASIGPKQKRPATACCAAESCGSAKAPPSEA
jgi:hypothetical protein